MIARIAIQKRDAHILSEIAECGFLTLGQIADLCFDGRRDAAKKRLQKLQQARILKRVFIGVLHPSLYMVGPVGAAARRSAGFPPSLRMRMPSALFIRHEILVRDFRAVLMLASRAGDLQVNYVSIDSRGLAFSTSYGKTHPDGYFEIGVGTKTLHFYFEIDNGTESQRVLIRRACSYHAYRQSGSSAKQRGIDAVSGSSFRFCALFLFTAERRRALFEREAARLKMSRFIMASSLGSARESIRRMAVML